jgi:hypothetical protein
MSMLSMWNFNRLNKKKEARCLAEGITEDRSDEFKDMGDASPLFRRALQLVRFATFAYQITRYII